MAYKMTSRPRGIGELLVDCATYQLFSVTVPWVCCDHATVHHHVPAGRVLQFVSKAIKKPFLLKYKYMAAFCNPMSAVFFAVLLSGLIINNKHFTCGMKDRVGTERDAEALTKLFIHLGFYTNRYDDLRGRDMHKKLQVRVPPLKPVILTTYLTLA